MFEKEKTEKKKAQHRRPGAGRHQMERGIKEGAVGRMGVYAEPFGRGKEPPGSLSFLRRFLSNRNSAW
jgi:hypothetical protein